jgi:hypothetical protein
MITEKILLAPAFGEEEEETFEELLANDNREDFACASFWGGFESLNGKIGLRPNNGDHCPSKYKEIVCQINLNIADPISSNVK